MRKILKTIPFTPKKYKEMQKKVEDLEKLRKEVMERLIIARGMGDLSENGAYKYAKFEFGNIGRQLKRYLSLLASGFPAPSNTGPKDLIEFGTQVGLEKLDGEKKDNKKIVKNFMIVSEHESDPSIGKIAYSSPMGKSVMRKKLGDKVYVDTPNGKSEWLVIEVR